MRIVKLAVIAVSAILGMASVSAHAASAADTARTYGVWRNPKNSVHLEIKDCGETACGVVIWASDRAKADARKGGSPSLVGLRLLRDFAPDKNGAWRGKVFVPDLNMTFSGAAEVLDAKTLRAKGCVLGGIICKSQIWTRVDAASVMASTVSP